MRVVFDIHGVTKYPGFSDVANLVSDLGYKVSFWTLGDSRIEIPLLEKMGLGHLTKDLIDGRMTQLLLDKIPRLDRSFLEVFLAFNGNELDNDALNHLDSTSQDWVNYISDWNLTNGDKLPKYPGILDDEPVLLVESDRKSWQKSTSGLFELDLSGYRGPLYKDIAEKSGVSIILIPEYPVVWDGPTLKIQPSDVIKELTRLIKIWDGKQLITDLGEKLSVYNEGNNYFLER